MSFEDNLIERILLEELLALLADEDRELVHMYYWDDLSPGEIGEKWGMKYRGRVLKEGTIRYHLKRITQLFQEWSN